MMVSVLAVVDDLFFRSKIEVAARGKDVRVCFVTPADAHRMIRETFQWIIVDLEAEPAALNFVKACSAYEPHSGRRIMGYLSHVRRDLARQAQDAGCDEVLARSDFSGRLDEIFNGDAH